MTLSHSYVCVTFLIVYGALWAWDIRFNIRFFAVAACLISTLELSVLEFGVGVQDFARYLTAAKRLRVSLIKYPLK